MTARPFTVADLSNVVVAVQIRMAAHDEDLHTALGVVLFNYGDRYAIAHCLGGEWHGPKHDLPGRPGRVPTCPNGHVLTQGRPKVLALVDEEDLR